MNLCIWKQLRSPNNDNRWPRLAATQHYNYMHRIALSCGARDRFKVARARSINLFIYWKLSWRCVWCDACFIRPWHIWQAKKSSIRPIYSNSQQQQQQKDIMRRQIWIILAECVRKSIAADEKWDSLNAIFGLNWFHMGCCMWPVENANSMWCVCICNVTASVAKVYELSVLQPSEWRVVSTNAPLGRMRLELRMSCDL